MFGKIGNIIFTWKTEEEIKHKLQVILFKYECYLLFKYKWLYTLDYMLITYWIFWKFSVENYNITLY